MKKPTMKLRVKRELLPMKRIHQKGHWNEKTLPKPKSSGKDIATPKDPPASILNRLRRRRFLLRHRGKPCHDFVLSKAMRSAIHVCGGKRPPGLRCKEWAMQFLPTKFASKMQRRHTDPSWNLILQKSDRVLLPIVSTEKAVGRVLQPTVSVKSNRELCTRWCALCGAPDPSMCWCAASLVATMHKENCKQFVEFYYGARNPLKENTDPTDQRTIQTALGSLAGNTMTREISMLVLGGVVLYLALVGKPDSLPQVQQALLNADWNSLRQSLKRVGKGKLFRGGQRPYAPGKAGLPDAMRAFHKGLGSDIFPLMNDLRKLRSSTSRAPTVYDLVERVASDTSIKCFGRYFKKRFLEILCLMGGIRLGGFRLDDSELDGAASVFPIADNSATALRRIFPAARNDNLRRQGMRTLSRSMAAGGSKISFCRMHAMLCFKQKQDGGVLSYS